MTVAPRARDYAAEYAARRPKGTPCEICHRVHPGRCTPEDARTINVCVTLPGRVHRLLHDRVPWGERSGWIARLVEHELDRGTP